MSLHIANLSSRVHRDELEHVFRKFGRCSVRVKDRYGFVVYEYPPNAEKAMKVLQGRRVCGELLTLSWSNKQPTMYKRFGRINRSNEPRMHRNSMDQENYFEGNLVSSKRQNHSSGLSDSTDLDIADYQADIRSYIDEELPGYEENLQEAVGTVGRGSSENGRWGDQSPERPSEEVMVRNDLEFERYEPYQADGRDDVNETNAYYPKYGKSRNTCFNCGGLGHKMHDCPQQIASARKFSRSGWGHGNNHTEGKGKGQLEVFDSKSLDENQAGGHAIQTGGQQKKKRLSVIGKQRELTITQSKGINGSKEGYLGERKLRRKEIDYPKGREENKARRSGSSALCLDNNTFILYSANASKNERWSDPPSKSKSMSFKAHSRPSFSRSTSASHLIDVKRPRSSSPISLSSSVSLGRPLPSSSNQGHMSLKGSADIAKTPESNGMLDEQGQPVACNAAFQEAQIEDEVIAVDEETLMSPFQVENELEKIPPVWKEDDDYHIVSTSVYEERKQSRLSADKGEAAGSSFLESSREAKEREASAASQMDGLPVLNGNLDSQAPMASSPGPQTAISFEELYMILKPCGLNLSDKNERQITTEAFFGSARFWPWEIIYYRRLKKGLISVENYAKRIEQNQEFGIVDKYIRSSSGWGEVAL